MMLTKTRFLIGLMLALFVSGQAAIPPVDASKADLVNILAEWQQHSIMPPFSRTLVPDWVGTMIEKTNSSGFEELKEAPRHVRFDRAHVWNSWHGETNLVIAVRYGHGNIWTTVFREKLPSFDQIINSEGYEQIENMLGRPSTCDNGLCYWLNFTTHGTNRIRVLSVASRRPDFNRNESNKSHIYSVSEGFFQRADASRVGEREVYKSGAEIYKEDQQAKAVRRATFPLPLRSLFEARETENDSDLKNYKSKLQELREAPTKELMEQFVQHIEEGTAQISGMVEVCFFDGWMNLTPWNPQKRVEALRHLANSLTAAKTSLALVDALQVIVDGEGGGDFRVSSNGKVIVDISVTRELTRSSRKYSVTPPNDALKSSAALCIEALKEKFPNLR